MSKEIKDNNIHWDADFNLKFTITNQIEKQLQYIPNNIFSVELPEMKLENVEDPEKLQNAKMIIHIRSLKSYDIEEELFGLLCRCNFNIDLYQSDNNIAKWSFNNCDVDIVRFPTLCKHPKALPFNIIVEVNVGQIVFHSVTGDITFGSSNSMSTDVLLSK